MGTKEKDAQRKSVGREGENVACRQLEAWGYEIIGRNFRGGRKEIDIICRDGNDIRFVEVKSRKEPIEGEPWEAVDVPKQKRLASAARSFLSSALCRNLPFEVNETHFDIFTVVWSRDGTQCRTEFIPDAFLLIYT